MNLKPVQNSFNCQLALPCYTWRSLQSALKEFGIGIENQLCKSKNWVKFWIEPPLVLRFNKHQWSDHYFITAIVLFVSKMIQRLGATYHAVLTISVYAVNLWQACVRLYRAGQLSANLLRPSWAQTNLRRTLQDCLLDSLTLNHNCR